MFCSVPTMIAPRGCLKIRRIETMQAVNLTSPSPPPPPRSRNDAGHAFLSSERGRSVNRTQGRGYFASLKVTKRNKATSFILF
jgi:hypothetical protein